MYRQKKKRLYMNYNNDNKLFYILKISIFSLRTVLITFISLFKSLKYLALTSGDILCKPSYTRYDYVMKYSISLDYVTFFLSNAFDSNVDMKLTMYTDIETPVVFKSNYVLITYQNIRIQI